MKGESSKGVWIGVPGATVDMEVSEKGGKFTIDDKSGWYWSGDESTFLTGLIRIANSKIKDDFLKKLTESEISKSDIKKAISISLQKDKKDGLYPLLGNNRVYQGWDSFIDSIWSDEAYEIESCIKEHGYPKEQAEEIADDVVSQGTYNLKSSQEMFNEIEEELAENFTENKSWKSVMDSIVRTCDRTNKSVDDFAECITETALKFKVDDPEKQFERESEMWYERYDVSHVDLKDLSKKHGVPRKVLTECALKR